MRGDKWNPASVQLREIYEDPGMWEVVARRGGQRWRTVICGGGPETRPIGELVVRILQDTDPERWDLFLVRDLKPLFQGGWG